MGHQQVKVYPFFSSKYDLSHTGLSSYSAQEERHFSILLNSVGMIYALVVITMVCRKKVSVRIKSLITSAVT